MIAAAGVDNVLLEWIMKLESHRAGRLQKVYPVLFGARSSADEVAGDFFADSSASRLPKIAPTTILAQAAELLSANGIQPSEKMQSYTVHSVVQELLLFLLCKASDFPSSRLVEGFAEKVVGLFEDCVSATQSNNITGVVDSKACVSPAETTTTAAAAMRPLKELSVAEVGTLLYRAGLDELAPLFETKKVTGKRLALCDEYAELMGPGIAVSSKVLAKELMQLIEEWKAAGVVL